MDKRRMCPHCRAFISSRDRVCPYCETEVGPRAADRRAPSGVIGGFIPHARFTTTIILLINFGLYAATALFSTRIGQGSAMNIDINTLFAFGATEPGVWWRLITAGFLHGGLLHILMNSWVLFDLGAQVEEIYGAARLIVFYFAALVFGFYVSTMFHSLSVGASGAIFGLIGAMIALGVRHREHPLGAALRGLYIRWAVYGLLFGLLPGFDNAAHIGGLAAGFAVAYVAGTPKLIDGWGERVWRVAAVGCVVVTALAFLAMYRSLTSLPGM